MKGMDLIFTPRCMFCRRILGAGAQSQVCPWCHPEEFRISKPRCRFCGRPAAEENGICPDCRQRRPTVTGRCLYAYEGIIRDALHRFKYGNCRGYGEGFARQLWEGLEETIRKWQPQLLVPVPLHPKRQRQRGYNQAAVTAAWLAEQAGIPWQNLLRRVRNTAPQQSLGYGLRALNIQEAFAVNEGMAVPDRILLIDDIYTTGSTIEACGEALRNRNAGTEAHFLTIAAKIFDKSEKST